MTFMCTWSGADGRMLESARVLINGRGLRALGRAVHVVPGDPVFTSSYRLVVDERGSVSRLSVTSATADRERTITLYRTEDGYWMLDTGSGGGRASFGGALDVDLAFSSLFNALPIRRLGLHREPGEHELPMVFVNLPQLDVDVTIQRYRTVSPLDSQQRSVVRFEWDDYGSDLVVDADGLVLDYPGLATRV